MCCDGSLFGFVPLRRHELEVARRHRLHVVASGRGFEQPCSALALHESSDDRTTRCTIYSERPEACRAFTCRLYDRQRREGDPVDGAIRRVRHVRALVDALRAMRLEPADFAEGGPPGKLAALKPSLAVRAREAYAELTQSLETDFSRAD
jgi:hypothetical protein